jgi:hypothetical protein
MTGGATPLRMAPFQRAVQRSQPGARVGARHEGVDRLRGLGLGAGQEMPVPGRSRIGLTFRCVAR